LTVNCTDFIAKNQWPPNSPDVNPLDYHVCGAMLRVFDKLHSKPKTIPELKSTLQQIWGDLPSSHTQRSTKLSTTFANVWTRAFRSMVVMNCRA